KAGWSPCRPRTHLLLHRASTLSPSPVTDPTIAKREREKKKSPIQHRARTGGDRGGRMSSDYSSSWARALVHISPYTFSAIGIAVSIGVSVLGAAW
uniref:Uncharacterized protein n=1 Tax=Aegilops tauschii subsp. strangulata TaxID=200361 RepID=A0A453F116_AEGTS